MLNAIGVTVRFGKRTLFEDVNIKFNKGCCYGIIGANGAGKSTFLKVLSGEIEPSKGEVTKDKTERLSVIKQEHFAYEDVTAYTTFLEEETGITDQKEKVSLIDRLVEQIKPSSIGASKRASMQSIVMSEKLLRLHMTDEQKAKNIAQKLSKNYFAHGHAVSKREAKELGLNILESNERIEKLIWDIYSDIEIEMKMNEPFNPLSEYLNNSSNTDLIAPPRNINIPNNIPPELAQQIMLSNCTITNGADINYELKFAIIESNNLSKCFITKGKLFGQRLPDMNYQLSTVELSSKWEDL